MDDYRRALEDVRELLDNARSNKGGVHWGDIFIEGAHWDFELMDQLLDLEQKEIDNDEDSSS